MLLTFFQSRLRYSGIVMLLAWAPLAWAEVPTIHDDIKSACESQRKDGSTAPYIRQNGEARFSTWQAAAEQGSAEGQWLLSRCYLLGVGVKKDEAEAVRWLRKSADQNFALAQNNLGLLYEKGTGVEKNLDMALTLYKKASEQGEPSACHNLARLYRQGIGGKVDIKEAIALLTRAADKDYLMPIHALGEMYEFGMGVDYDAGKAARWYRKASDLGDVQATLSLIALYQEDTGLEKDAAELKRLHELAQKQRGDDSDKGLAGASARIIRGSWRLPVVAGESRYVLTLTFMADGIGQFYIFQPTNAQATEGALTAAGFTYKIERQPGKLWLVIDECTVLPEKKAKIGFTASLKQRLFEQGKALRSEDDKTGLEMKGEWSLLDTDEPYGGIQVGPNNKLIFGRYVGGDNKP